MIGNLCWGFFVYISEARERGTAVEKIEEKSGSDRRFFRVTARGVRSTSNPSAPVGEPPMA